MVTEYELTVRYVVADDGEPQVTSIAGSSPPLEFAVAVPDELVADAVKTLLMVMGAAIEDQEGMLRRGKPESRGD